MSKARRKTRMTDQSQIQTTGKTHNFLNRIKTIAKNKGPLGLLNALVNRVIRTAEVNFWYLYNKMRISRSTFLFQGNQYRYFVHKYNMTWRNERMVEVPIIRKILRETKGEVLEIGNVLSHYFDAEHDIVDKYERGKGVLTRDVTEIETSKRYDLIITISTLEHVGWDENPDFKTLLDDEEKILKAVSKLQYLLKPNGRLIITVPLGYNPYLDDILRTGKLEFSRQFYMKRLSGGNKWIEATSNEVKEARFNKQIPTANAILIGIFENHI